MLSIDSVSNDPAKGAAPPHPGVITVDSGSPVIDTTVSTVSCARPAINPGTSEPAEVIAPSPVAAHPPEAKTAAEAPAATPTKLETKEVSPVSILAIDIGGTKVKILAKGQTEARKAPTGKEFTPTRLVEIVGELAADWEYEAISIGYPGLVGAHGPRSEPGNLGPGWVGFDFAAAFGKPVKMINDAVMQALGSYDGGRMLFLGLGTGLGSALIAGQVIVPLELGRMRYDNERAIGEVLGRRGLAEIGKTEWRGAVNAVVTAMMHAFLADYVVIGGGNAKLVKDLPPGARLGNNLTAFRGGFRLWGLEDVWVMAPTGGESPQLTLQDGLRVV